MSRNGILSSDYLISKPSKELLEKVQMAGLRVIDLSFEFTEGRDPYNFFLDLSECPMFDEDTVSLKKLSRQETYFTFMEKIWKSTLPPVMKFFIQDNIDWSVQTAEQILRSIENNHFYCFSLYGGDRFTFEEFYQTYKFYPDLQRIYDEAVIQK